jgi:rRNA maturation protein Rpf1
MSLLVIDFTFLEERDSELVVKELVAVDSNSNRVSSYVFKRPYNWEDVPMLNARINHAIDHGCNWNDGDVLYSELETVLLREASSAVAIY